MYKNYKCIIVYVCGFYVYISTECIDFDEETADDKDIDMGMYYGHSEGNVVISIK